MSSIAGVLKILRRQFPNLGAMELGDPYRTLVAVILSARTRDEQVLKLLPAFFHAFPTMATLAKATVKQIETKLSTIGMYRQKAKNLKGMAEKIERADKADRGKIPKTMEGLVALPGVGRKTASVVLVACFNTPAIAVDTHVHRVINRLGWVKTKTPEQTEAALLKIVPVKWQSTVNRVFVKFGRYICIPGKPRCYLCPIRSECKFTQKNLTIPKNIHEIKEDIERRERDLEDLRRNVRS